MNHKEYRCEILKKLKPCPFCGGRPYLEDSHRSFVDGQSTKVSFIRCARCNARSARFDTHRYGTKEAVNMAVNSWNKRYKEERWTK